MTMQDNNNLDDLTSETDIEITFHGPDHDESGSLSESIILHPVVPDERYFSIRRWPSLADYLVSFLVIVILIAVNVLSLPTFLNLILLTAYSLHIGYRLRRGLVAGLICFIIAIGTALFHHGTLRIFMSSHAVFNDILKVLFVPLIMFAVALTSGAVSYRLLKPVSLDSILRRFNKLVAPSAFRDFGLRFNAYSILNSSKPVQFINGSQRKSLITGLFNEIKRIVVPSIYVKNEEVINEKAVRLVPDNRCTLCSGRGIVKCDCRTSKKPVNEPEDIELVEPAVCIRCKGSGFYRCACVDEITYEIPEGVPNGYIAYGSCGNPDHKHYAKIFSRNLAFPYKPALVQIMSIGGLILGFFTLLNLETLVNAPDLTTKLNGYFVIAGYMLWFIGAFMALLAFRTGWYVIRLVILMLIASAFFQLAATPSGIVSVMSEGISLGSIERQLIIFIRGYLFILALAGWHSLPVKAYFGFDVDPADALFPGLFPLRDRFFSFLRSAGNKVVLAFAVLVIITWVTMDIFFGVKWDITKARATELTRNYEQAIEIYESILVENIEDDELEEALNDEINQLMCKILEDGIIELSGEELNEDEVSEDDTTGEDVTDSDNSEEETVDDENSEDTVSKLVEVCRELGRNHLTLDSEIKEKTPALMLTFADILLDRSDWDNAGIVLRTLVTSFQDSPEASSADSRTEWRFNGTTDVERALSIESRPHTGVVGGEHDYYMVGQNRKLVIVGLELAHIGNTRKDLPSGIFSLVDNEGQIYPGLGIRQDDVYIAYEYGDFGLQTPVLQTGHYLLRVGYYPGITLGPDLIQTSVVFEVVRGKVDFELRINGEKVDEITTPVY